MLAWRISSAGIGLLCQVWGAKKLEFYCIFCGGTTYTMAQRKVECVHCMHNSNLPLSNDVKNKTISLFRHVSGEVAFMNFTIQKHDRVEQTYKKQTLNFFASRWGQSPSATIFGLVIEEVVPYSCISQMFSYPRYSFIAIGGGGWKFGEKESPPLNLHNSGTPIANTKILIACS